LEKMSVYRGIVESWKRGADGLITFFKKKVARIRGSANLFSFF